MPEYRPSEYECGDASVVVEKRDGKNQKSAHSARLHSASDRFCKLPLQGGALQSLCVERREDCVVASHVLCQAVGIDRIALYEGEMWMRLGDLTRRADICSDKMSAL